MDAPDKHNGQTDMSPCPFVSWMEFDTLYTLGTHQTAVTIIRFTSQRQFCQRRRQSFSKDVPQYLHISIFKHTINHILHTSIPSSDEYQTATKQENF